MDRPSLKTERSIGELLSDALGVMRRHFKLLFVVSLPFCALGLILREAASAIMLGAADAVEKGTDADAILRFMTGFAAGMALSLAAMVAQWLLTTGHTALAGEAWRDRPLTASIALSAVASRGGWVVLTWVLFLLVLFVAAIPATLIASIGIVVVAVAPTNPLALAAGIGTMVLAFLAWLITWLVLYLRWALFDQATVLEQKWGPWAFSRSSDLMARRGLPFFESPKFRLSILALLIVLLSSTMSSLFAGPRFLVAWSLGWNFSEGLPPLASLPLWFIVPFGLLEVATMAVLVPFAPILLSLFYFDLRVRYEGIDLDVAVGGAAAGSEPGTDPPPPTT